MRLVSDPDFAVEQGIVQLRLEAVLPAGFLDLRRFIGAPDGPLALRIFGGDHRGGELLGGCALRVLLDAERKLDVNLFAAYGDRIEEQRR